MGKLPTEAVLRTHLLGSNPPDIVITGQTGDVTATVATIYAEYLKKGGLMPGFIEAPERINRLLSGLYPGGSIVTD